MTQKNLRCCWRIYKKKLEHAESIHCTVTMMILSQWRGSVDLQRSAQAFKSKSRVILNKIELNFKYNPWWMMNPSHRLKRKHYLPLTKWWQVVPTSRNRTRQNNRNSRAYQQAHPPPRRSSRLINGSGMTFLPLTASIKSLQVGESQGRWRYFLDIKNFLEKLTEQSVTCGTTWIGNRRCWEFLGYKPRCQYCVDSNENLLYIRAIQGHPGGALVDTELLNYVAIPLGWKEYS